MGTDTTQITDYQIRKRIFQLNPKIKEVFNTFPKGTLRRLIKLNINLNAIYERNGEGSFLFVLVELLNSFYNEEAIQLAKLIEKNNPHKPASISN